MSAALLLLMSATATEAFFSFTPTVKVVTFNAALIPPFPQLEERRDILIQQSVLSISCRPTLQVNQPALLSLLKKLINVLSTSVQVILPSVLQYVDSMDVIPCLFHNQWSANGAYHSMG